MKRKIYCYRCYDTIDSKDELVTALRGVSLECYHARCYSRQIKGYRGVNTGGVVNSVPYLIGMVVAIAASLFAIILNRNLWFVGIVVLILPAVRMLSWYWYERRLE